MNVFEQCPPPKTDVSVQRKSIRVILPVCVKKSFPVSKNVLMATKELRSRNMRKILPITFSLSGSNAPMESEPPGFQKFVLGSFTKPIWPLASIPTMLMERLGLNMLVLCRRSSVPYMRLTMLLTLPFWSMGGVVVGW